MTNKMYHFPADFWWGAALSAEQSEGFFGSKAKTIYDQQFNLHPEQFFEQIGPSQTSAVSKFFAQDIALYQEIGFNSFRTSFSWARLFPNGMKKPPSLKAIRFYHQYLDQCKAHQIEFIATLFHFDLPLWAQQKGGWESKSVIEDFVQYAKFVFQEFGSKIKYFVTMNEPFIPAINGYINGRHYPNYQNLNQAFNVAFGIILAHAKIVKVFRDLKLKAQIGGVFDARLAYPISQSSADQEAAKIANLLLYEAMTDSMIIGKFSEDLKAFGATHQLKPKLATKENLIIIKQTNLDFYGINYYTPLRVKKGSKNSEFGSLFTKCLPSNVRLNPHRQIEIYPEGLYDIIKSMHLKYQKPLFISENGIGIENEARFRDQEGIVNDQYRIAFIKEHLVQVHKALREGIPLFGYHLWAAIDNWSWINAYKNRYGLIEVDLNNNFARKIKKSGYWWKQLVKDNGFAKNFKKIEAVIDFANYQGSKSF